jgi:hypothetical protein
VSNPDVHFVVPKSFSAALADLPSKEVGVDFAYWVGGQFNWVAQSWLILRQYREGLTICTEPRPGHINFAHSMAWRALGRRQGEFRVGVRADYPRLFDVDFEILQNPVTPKGRFQAYLPYWPVPGLVPRDPKRAGIKRVAYAGRIGQRNLDRSLEATISVHPATRDLEFVIVEPNQWHDLSQIDLLIAIRDFDCRPHDNKPPSKLFNAWHAGVPLIAGWDSAFSAVGRPSVDYIRVGSMEEFFCAVSRLREDRNYYEEVTGAGRERSAAFSHEAIAREWLALFENRIKREFELFQSSWSRHIRSPMHGLADQVIDRARKLKSWKPARAAGVGSRL